jgi:flavin reductase (DIM6/NTAB) family NADH-FMN oxidoreductase RutF
MLFDMNAIPPKERYKLLTSTVVPRPIAWVVTQDAQGRRNAAPFSFFNVFANDPPVVGFSAGERLSGGNKDTIENIRATGQFVVCLVGEETATAMNVTGAEVETGVDETRLAGLSVLPSVKVAPPRIAESPVAMECETFQIVPIGDYVLILGRVLAMHIRDDCVLDAGRHYIDSAGLKLIGRMAAPDWYVRTTDRFAMPRATAEQVMKRD